MCFLANRLIKISVWPGAVTRPASFCPRHVVANAAQPWGQRSCRLTSVFELHLCVRVFVVGGWWDGCIQKCDWTRLQVTAVWAQNKKLPSSHSVCPTPFLYAQCHICSTGGSAGDISAVTMLFRWGSSWGSAIDAFIYLFILIRRIKG